METQDSPACGPATPWGLCINRQVPGEERARGSTHVASAHIPVGGTGARVTLNCQRKPELDSRGKNRFSWRTVAVREKSLQYATGLHSKYSRDKWGLVAKEFD